MQYESKSAPLAHRIPAACQRIGIGRTMFYELVAAGEIKTIRIGARVLVPESELLKVVSKRMKEAA